MRSLIDINHIYSSLRTAIFPIFEGIIIKLSATVLLMLTPLTQPLMGEEPTTTDANPAVQDAVATVVGKLITNSNIVAAETEFNRKKMDDTEFEKWQLYSRKKCC